MDSVRLPLQIEITISKEMLKALFEFAAENDRQVMTPKERSQHANYGGQKPPENLGLLLDTK